MRPASTRPASPRPAGGSRDRPAGQADRQPPTHASRATLNGPIGRGYGLSMLEIRYFATSAPRRVGVA